MTAFEKRVKRNVTGRDHIFYLTVAPGFESAAETELSALGISRSGPVETGGFEFTGRITDSMRVNLLSRCGTRVLMRLVEFRARRFHSIYEKTARFPWELYLKSGSELKYKVSSSGSRLYHTGRVGAEIHRGIKARLKESGADSKSPGPSLPQTIFCRIENDLCTLSLDSSGDPLYKRGYKTGSVRAPLRENIAAAILLEAGLLEADIICDPMCGSATFSTEAAGILSGSPAGANRRFAFEEWPCFSAASFSYLKRLGPVPLSRGIHAPEIIASDIDRSAVEAAEKNISAAGCGVKIGLVRSDFFDLQIPPPEGRRCLVVLNPPYGERLITEDLTGFYSRIGEKLRSSFKGWSFALISPDPDCERAAGLVYDKKILFRNGGLQVRALFGGIPA